MTHSKQPANVTHSRQLTAKVTFGKVVYDGKKVRRLDRPRFIVTCEMCEYYQAGVNESHANEIRVKHLKTAHFEKLLNGTATIYMRGETGNG